MAAVRTFFSLKLVLPPGTTLSFEEIYKRRLFSSLIIPGIAILLTFGLHHLFNANYIEGSLDVFASLWLIFSVLWLRQLKKGLMIYRINASLLALLFLFLVAKGGTGGNKIFWAYSFPLIAFYTLGMLEGLLWTSTIFCVILGILFFPLDAQWIYSYYEVLNLNDLIDDYLQSPEMQKLKYHHPGVEIRANPQTDLFNTKGSAIHLRKTLINLISNAAEALLEGGRVQVCTRNQYIDRRLKGYSDVNEGEYVVLSISDNGDGISDEDLSHIFEPFYTKKKMGRSGTGLGLAVVWGTVRDHNGYINVTSKIGEGTCMELYLPATRESIKRQEQTIPQKAYHGNGEQILVVDDVEAQRDITSEMLTELGYLVDTVGSGEEAVSYFKTNTVDLVILDMIMDPGIDGLETYTRLLAIRPNLKALIVSGFSETARVKQAQLLGAGAYVKKPFNIETIGVAVRRELNR